MIYSKGGKEDTIPVLNIKDSETHALASELAQLTNETMSQAVKQALKDKLARTKAGQSNNKLLAERVLELAREIASNPVLDARTPEEIIGYDEHGIPR